MATTRPAVPAAVSVTSPGRAPLTIENSTLAFNTANNAAGGGAAADGGGLSVDTSVTGTPVQLISTIVSNNVSKVGVAGSGTEQDVQGNSKGVYSFSLVKTIPAAGIGLTDLGNNQNSKDPKLIADASNNPVNNGGPTNTYALTPGTMATPNPAVDTGFNAAGLTTDRAANLASTVQVRTSARFKFIITPATITATSGGGQSAPVNTTFANPLVATVTDSSGNPIPNVTVTFAAPTTGASVTFPGGATVLTNALGQASTMVTANGTAGSFTVTATAAGLATSVSFALTNTGTATSATITALTSTTPNGTYDAGTALQNGKPAPTINITITFSAPVTLAGGNLTVTLSNGAKVTITPFTGTTATGTYTVAQTDADAIPLDTTSLTLAAGATLKDASNSSVPLTFAATQSLKATSTINVKNFNFQTRRYTSQRWLLVAGQRWYDGVWLQ